MAQSLFEPFFSTSTASYFKMRFLLARLVSAENVSPHYGILINTDVGNPTAPFITALGRQASFTRLVGTHNRIRPYKGIRIPSSSLTPSLYLRPSNLELQRPSSHLFCLEKALDHVRIWSARQVDGLLRQGEGHLQASGGRVPGQRNRPPASCQGADRPHPEAQ